MTEPGVIGAAVPELRTTDLSLPGKLPPGVKLTGLGEPQFQSEGVYYRLASSASTLKFELARPAWVQYRFHSLLPDREVTARVTLNGKLLESVTFPAAGQVVHLSAGPGRVGANRWQVEYRCDGAPCPVPVPVYWLQLGVSNLNHLPARQIAGPHVEWWNLGAPGTRVSLRGLSAPLSDGTQVYRRVQDDKVHVRWPEGVRPLSLSFEAAAGVPFTVTAQSGQQVLGRWKGTPEHGAQVGLSLYPLRPVPEEITLRVKCLAGPPGCVNLYRMNMGIQSVPEATTGTRIVTPLLLGVLLLALLWWFRPWVAGPPAPAPRRPTTTR